ncbi:MAG: hypothetical protein NUV51_05830, partial [Sulfuricaulis sp.]|nr:hypothetical protein [Sulfuricaulis sp.]
AVGFTEAIANDVMTQEVDSRLTYNRPKPIATAPADAPDASEEVLDLSGPELKLLQPGYTLDDAYAKFRSMAIDPTIGMVLGLGQNQSIAPVVGGQSPSADASGFSLNLLTSNAIGPYMPLLMNKATAWGKVVDFTRQVVKHTLKESVELVVSGSGADADRVEWVALKPDDVTDIPCQVDIDPISDAERIGLAKHFLEGVIGGYVPERILQERGYGSENVDFWREEIIQDAARRLLAQYEVQQALREMIEEEAIASNPTPTILGPNGQPLPPSTGEMQQAGGMPQEPRPSTVGRENVPGSGGQAGQKPLNQGVSQAAMNGAGGF